MPKSIPHITALINDFHALVHSSDEVIVNRFLFYRGTSRKRLFAKSVVYNGYRLKREPARITIELLDTQRGGEPVVTALYSFVPTPDFSQRRLGT